MRLLISVRAKATIEDYASGKTKFEALRLGGVISSIVLGLTSTAQSSFVRQVGNYPRIERRRL